MDLAAEKTLGELLINASRDGMVDAAHDLSEGGLAAALAEMSLRFGVGARVAIDDLCERDGVDAFTALFSESQGRALVALPRSEELRFTDMTSARGFPRCAWEWSMRSQAAWRSPGPSKAAASASPSTS